MGKVIGYSKALINELIDVENHRNSLYQRPHQASFSLRKGRSQHRSVSNDVEKPVLNWENILRVELKTKDKIREITST